MTSSLRDSLFHAILRARERVYALGAPTPLEKHLTSEGSQVFVKREDLSPIHAYKWRGAYNAMCEHREDARQRGVITASAGNHAQGVARAARHMQVRATIVMPQSTPRMKQQAVAEHGGEWVEIILKGDTYDQASAHARHLEQVNGAVYIHAYDDIATMGGQGTLADEIIMSGQGPWDRVYLQIGGGGMAAAVACWLKTYHPGIKIIGVEGELQASMQAAVKAGHPVELPQVDVFADGTAVSRVGNLTFELCRDLIDEWRTVSNEELCAAIQWCWERSRVIAEPSGAMGLAGWLQERDAVAGQRILTVLCGANMDFGQLGWISRHGGIGSRERHYYRFAIPETRGTFLNMLKTAFDGINIVEFQYGKTDEETGYPVIGFEATADQCALIEARCKEADIPATPIPWAADVDFRIIHYDASLLHWPWFIIYKFPERSGALKEMLEATSPVASLCYFNYLNSGERVGRTLMGFEFESPEQREALKSALDAQGHEYEALTDDEMARML